MLTPGSFCTARELSTPSQDTHAQGRSFSEGPQSAKESFLLRSLPKHPKSRPGPTLCTSASPTTHFHQSTHDPGLYMYPSLPLDHSDGAGGALLAIMSLSKVPSVQ